MPIDPQRTWDYLSRRVGAQKPAAPLELRPEETLANRELSWLLFNDRVLAEAADPSVPPLERLRFATIVSSNLDEFFMVRIAELARIARAQPQLRFPDGLTAAQLYARVREHVLAQKHRQAQVFREIVDALQPHKIMVHAEFGAAKQMDDEVLSLLPELDVSLHRSNQGLLSVSSERIHVFVRFPGEFAVVTINDRDSRLLHLPKSGTHHYVLIDRWLASRAQKLFPGRTVIEAFPFKVIREADLSYRPDEEDRLQEQIVAAVHRRSKARIVRMEIDNPTYSEGALYLATAMRLDSAALYRFDLPLDLRTLALIYREPGGEKLRYPAVQPKVPIPVKTRSKTFALIREHDFLLHHPYDSFDPVVNFIQQAANDPAVTRIYHTMYRTSVQSPTMEALKEAVRNGKKVTVYVEIKARFDELNNVFWSEELRKAGVKVIRPLGGLKVHSKVTQILRKEEDGSERSYLHLGTGNYNPSTAKQYTDLSLLTSDPALGADISRFFEALSRGKRPSGFSDLLVAPVSLRSGMMRLIREETELARKGEKAHIIAKMNSLVDRDMIRALYEASQAGVKIDLIIRGICCLIPGLAGVSDNIRVVSVVDRFLEHSRIFYFRAGGKKKVYLSSADWMPRNFFTRLELAFPIKDPVLGRFIRRTILAYGLQDNVKSWAMRPDGTYDRVPVPGPQKQFRSQFAFEELAREDYAGTVLFNRVPV